MSVEDFPPVLAAADLVELLAAGRGARVLDVRTPGEYEAVHIQGAYNVPLDTLGEHARDIQTHVEEPVVLVCQSGGRARKAEEALRAAGMPQLHVLDGGLNAWIAAGRPVARGRSRVSLERQVRMIAGTLAASGGFLALAVSPLFGLIPGMVGLGLFVAGATDTCTMGLLLSRLPYNQPASCDVEGMVRALRSGLEPPAPSRAGRLAPPRPPATCES